MLDFTMIDAEQIRFICGFIGVAMYLVICAYPLPLFITAVKQMSVAKLHPDYFLLKILNCALWFIYSLPMVHEDGIFIRILSGLGFVINFIYLTVFCVFNEGEKLKHDTRKVVIFAHAGTFFAVAVIQITNLACETPASKHKFLGLTCLVYGLFLSLAHIAAMETVVKTNSVEHMPFWCCFHNFLYSVILIVYSSAYLIDLYFLIMNVVGAFLAVCQLVIYLYYSRPKLETGKISYIDGSIIIAAECVVSIGLPLFNTPPASATAESAV